MWNRNDRWLFGVATTAAIVSALLFVPAGAREQQAQLAAGQRTLKLQAVQDVKPVQPGLEEAFAFDISAPGALRVQARWEGTQQATAFLYGPGRKTPYARQTGKSPLTLSHEITAATVQAGTRWIVHVLNVSTEANKLAVSVSSPGGVAVRSVTSQPQEITEAAALVLHMLDRFANDAPNPTDLDRQMAAALDPNAKPLLRQKLNEFKALPASHRRALLGAKWAARKTTDAVSPTELEPFRERLRTFQLPALPEGAKASPGDPPVAPPPPANQPGAWFLRNPFVATLHAQTTQQRIDFAGIYCNKETYWDQASNADEPYVIFAVTDGYTVDTNHTATKKSAIYPDVDTGEAFGPSPILLSVWGPGYQPVPSGRDLGIDVIVMESDSSDFPASSYASAVNEALKGTVQMIGVPSVYDATTSAIIQALNQTLYWLLDLADDEISRAGFVVTPAQLKWYAQQPYSKFKAPTNGVTLYYNKMVFLPDGVGWWNGARYRVAFKIRPATTT